MIQTPGYLSSTAFAPVGTPSDYIASAAHYAALARRIVTALRSGDGRLIVLVAGDPPASPEVLCEALSAAAGPGYAAMLISCGSQLTRDDLERAAAALAKRGAKDGAAGDRGYSAPPVPLFVFADFDRLSNRQIQEIYEDTQRPGEFPRAAVALAPLDFLARLEQPALRFLNERIAARLRFQEVGDDEAVAALHNQLLAQRDRRVEARGFRRGILIGSAAGGVAIVASVAVFLLHSTAEQACDAPMPIRQSSSASDKLSMPRPAQETATSAGEAPTGIVPEQAVPRADATLALAPPPSAAAAPPPSVAALAAPPPAKVQNQPPAASPAAGHPSASPRLSAAEVSALLGRGDAFLSAGDITSARLFYERAADAESGLAALRLGATFDTVFPGPAKLRAPTADPVRALFWYRRARELGIGEAERRIKVLETGPGGAANTPIR